MKKINYVKFTLDLVMAVLFVLFFNKRVLGGLTFHEIAGLGFAAAYFTHILLNLQWVKRVTLKLFDRKLPWGTRFGYVLNLSLLLTMTTIIVSGILVSHVVFPNINVSNERWFQTMHISLSFVTLILVGVHVGLHWKWVVGVWNKLLNIRTQKWAGPVLKLATVALLVYGGYEIYTTSFMTRVASASSIFSGTAAQGMGGHMEGGKQFAQRPAGENSAMPAGAFNGERPEGGFKGGREGGMGGANPLTVIATYTGIMGVFVIATYYITKLLRRKPKAV